MADPLTVLEVIQKTTTFFTSKHVESARLNAELLIGHALGLKRMQLYLQFERVLTEADLELIRPLVRRRSQREPLQYILGEVEWSGLKLKVDRRALIPRPETEYLVELLTARAPAAPSAVLDLGTGTGAIALALAKQYPNATVTAIDASADALSLAGENARALGLETRVKLQQSDWFTALAEGQTFDVIVSNPPYLTATETDEAEPEVRAHEPVSALIAKDDGLADLRMIIRQAPRYLNPGGLLALETGITQHAELLQLVAAAGLVRAESRKDLTERDRFIFAWAPGEAPVALSGAIAAPTPDAPDLVT